MMKHMRWERRYKIWVQNVMLWAGTRLNAIAPEIIVTLLAIDECNGPGGDFYKNMNHCKTCLRKFCGTKPVSLRKTYEK